MSMKFKTKKKEIMAGYSNVICVGYCELQNLLNYKNPVAYTTRAEGWGCDIYEVDQNTVIATGYAPFGNIDPSYALIRQYDDEAAKYISEHHSDAPEHLDALLKELVDKIITEYKGKSK